MYILLGIILVVVVLWIWFLVRRKKAISKVKTLSDEEKVSYINAILNPFGFIFDIPCDIVISQNDSWQREYGYMDLYDYKAPAFKMVYDAEVINFLYEGKYYRIELWKGQYGITTGAEVGIYIRDNKNINFYRCANDEERLDIEYILTKKCDLFCRCDKSWWLTGFDVGKFSRPSDLKMDICICFKTLEMKDAFVDSLIALGYSQCQLNICDTTVCFEYCCPKYYKPNYHHRITKFFAQICNYINTSIYNCLTRPFNRTLDKLTYIKLMLPCLYRMIVLLTIPRRKQKKYYKRINKNK